MFGPVWLTFIPIIISKFISQSQQQKYKTAKCKRNGLIKPEQFPLVPSAWFHSKSIIGLLVNWLINEARDKTQEKVRLVNVITECKLHQISSFTCD